MTSERRMVSADEARGLIVNATGGRWEPAFASDGTEVFVASLDVDWGSVSALDGEKAASILASGVVDRENDPSLGNALLMASAPDLAHTVIALHEEVARLREELARLHRACTEGLPRERIDCPRCGMRHIDGADSSQYGSRPHHTHLCQPENGGCGHVFDTGRWSYGAAIGADECNAQKGGA